VVIVAAGSGERMGISDKALLLIGGEPALAHSLRAASLARGVEWIVIVTRPDLLDEVGKLIEPLQLPTLPSVVTGGDSRSVSVFNGVNEAARVGATFVAVHDAARPLVTPEIFEAVFVSAERSGAAIAAVPVVDTLKRVGSDGCIVETVDRADIWSAQTPQCFRTDELLGALANARASESHVTDESSLFELVGLPVNVVEGDRMNIKLTYPADVAIVNALFEARHGEDR